MALVYRTVVGNTAPTIQITLKRNGTVIDLSGATGVVMAIRDEMTEVTTNSVQTCSIVAPATGGIVSYVPAISDFPREGRYVGDVKVSYTDGTTEHIAEILVVIARAAIS
jgi:hypothetical protein